MTVLLRIVLPGALLVAGLGVLIAVGRRSPPESRTDQGRDMRPVVATQPVSQHPAGLDVLADGIVVPYREITLAAEVSGTVVFKSPDCNEGTFVPADQKLLEIDPSDYELEIRRLQAELSQAQGNLKELNVELENTEQLVPLAQRELTLNETQQSRMTTLQARGVVSREEVEETERRVISGRNALLEATRKRDSLRTRRASLQAAIDVVQVRLEQAQLNLQRTTITAPVSGVIIRDDVEKDSYVQTGATLFMMEDTEKVEVRCNLRMEEMRWIWQQAPQAGESPQSSSFDARFAALNDPSETPPEDLTNYHSLPPTAVTVQYELGGHVYQWQGQLDRYDGLGLDERTRMVPCRVVVEDPRTVSVDGEVVTTRGPRSLVRGMYVRLIIHTRPTAELLSVPEEAVQPGNIVWRVANGKLQRVELQVAESLKNSVLVDAAASGLAAGDRLVTSPLQAPFAGLEVRAEDGP